MQTSFGDFQFAFIALRVDVAPGHVECGHLADKSIDSESTCRSCRDE